MIDTDSLLEEVVAGSLLVKLRGSDEFLLACERCLPAPYDPCCLKLAQREEDGSEEQTWGLWLYSRVLNRLPEANVWAGATALLAQLRGAIEIAYQPPHPPASSPTNSVNFVRLGAEGAKTWTVGNITINLRGPPAFDPPNSVGESEVQKWLAAGEGNDDIADMLTFASRYDSWFDIYKALELAARLVGGGQRKGNPRKLKKILGARATAYASLRETADTYRHARSDGKASVDIRDAQKILGPY